MQKKYRWCSEVKYRLYKIVAWYQLSVSSTRQLNKYIIMISHRAYYRWNMDMWTWIILLYVDPPNDLFNLCFADYYLPRNYLDILPYSGGCICVVVFKYVALVTMIALYFFCFCTCVVIVVPALLCICFNSSVYGRTTTLNI